MKEKCKSRGKSGKKRDESTLPLGAANSTVGGSSKVLLRDDPQEK